MRLQRLRFEFRMELASDEKRMTGNLHDLDVRAIRSRTGNAQPGGNHRLFIFAIEFVTMPVALADLGLAIHFVRERSRFDFARPCAQRAWCRRGLPRRAIRAACRSRDGESPDRTHSSWHRPIRRRCAHIQCTPSAYPGRFRSRARASRARTGSPATFLQCRACQILPARAGRRILLIALHSSCRFCR